MSKLRVAQNLFANDMARLILWCQEHGYEVSMGECWRPPEMQAIYVRTGRSKTMNSQHGKRLAADLNIFKDGVLLSTFEELRPVGQAWEAMSSSNSWGGFWSSFKDLPHFERRFT